MNRCPRLRLTVLWLLFFFFWYAGSVQAAVASPTLFEQSLQKLETKLKNGAAAHEYTFIVMGDSRDDDEVFVRILKAAASYRPLFILHDGDAVSTGARKEYDRFLELVNSTVPDIPFFVVVGNHEVKKKEGEKLFAEKIGPLDYVLDPAGLGMKIVALNNARYVLTSAQLQYLDEELSRGRKLNFTIMHIPPRTSRWDTKHCFSQGADELRRILTNRKVPLAFFGHEHVYDEDMIGGVRYIITGGAGAPLGSSGFGEAAYHFIVVKVKNGAATTEMVRLPR